MTHFVTGLVIVQFLLGIYQFSFTWGIGRPESGARATRLPPGVLFSHVVVAVVAGIVWLVYEGSGTRAAAWTGFGAFVLNASLGAVMGLRMVGKPLTLPETQGPSSQAASLIVAEKQIPAVSIALHATVALLLVVCSLLIALRVVSS